LTRSRSTQLSRPAMFWKIVALEKMDRFILIRRNRYIFGISLLHVCESELFHGLFFERNWNVDSKKDRHFGWCRSWEDRSSCLGQKQWSMPVALVRAETWRRYIDTLGIGLHLIDG
jgi:hypothetical protein